ncbi:hypothetical protein BCR44DRAFT_28903, partial [Catenaria anguillulae PL171]
MTADQSQTTITTEFAVDMTCASCEQSVRSALAPVPGIRSLAISIPEKRVVIEAATSVPASHLFTALKSTALPVVIRGQGPAGHNHSAVCVLEATNLGHDPAKPYGVVRLTQLQADRPGAVADVTATGLLPGADYQVSITDSGDLSRGVQGLGDPRVKVAEGKTDTQGRLEVVGQPLGNVWDWVGYGLILRTANVAATQGAPASTTAVYEAGGVIARSAGAFENSKTVCACSGRTLWEEKLGWVPSEERKAG